MHNWKNVKTWKPKRRSYHRHSKKIFWRTKWVCTKCGLIQEKPHIHNNKEITNKDKPDKNMIRISNFGKTKMTCEEITVENIMKL